MSRRRSIIYFYENLPSGGAKVCNEIIYKELLNTSSNKFKVKRISENYKSNNILQYLIDALLISRINQIKIAKNINRNGKLLICNQTWLTNSPYLLRYVRIPKIFICHEGLREYYEEEYKSSFTIKEKVVNYLRLPILHIDKTNIRLSRNTIFIANSKFSKSILEKYYSREFKVIYPRILTNNNTTTRKYKLGKEINFVSVGSINKLKRQDFYLDILKEMSKEFKVSLTLIGNGGNQNYIKTLIKNAKRDKVDLRIFLNISERKKRALLRKSDIFLYAPINEPYGLVLQEASEMNLPIVCYSRGGGYSEDVLFNDIKVRDLNVRNWVKSIKRIRQRLNNTNISNNLALKKYSSIEMFNEIQKNIKSMV